MLGRILRRFFGIGNIQFNEILDDILRELLRAIDDGEDMDKIARKLEKEYSRKTGLSIKIEVNKNGATIWINDLHFNYEFVNEFVTDGVLKSNDLSYIR